MREVIVTWDFNGEIIAGVLTVRADYLTSLANMTKLKNLLECNGRVLSMMHEDE